MDSNSKKNIDELKNVYNKIAAVFWHTRQKDWPELLPLVSKVRERDRVLDIGCGFGRLYGLLQEKKVEYVGVDNSAEQIRLGRETYPSAKFIEAEMTRLPFPDGQFDIVFCIAAFHHLPTEELRLLALQEMKRVARPRAMVMFTNWNMWSEWAQKKYGAGEKGNFFVPWKDATGNVLGERYYHGFTMEELADLFSRSGFQIIDQYFVKKDERCEIIEAENIISIIKV